MGLVQNILLAWGYNRDWNTLYHDAAHALISAILYILKLHGIVAEPWASRLYCAPVLLEVGTSRYTFGKENWWSSLRDLITYLISYPFVLMDSGLTIWGWTLLVVMLVAYFPLLLRTIKEG